MGKTKIILLIILSTLMIVSLSGCSINKEEEQTQSDEPTPVVIKQVEEKSVQQTKRYIGKVKAVQDIMVLSKIAGTVKEIYVNQGDMVKEGQLLIKLDDKDVTDALHQAEAAYQSALANLVQAKEGRSSRILQAETQLKQAEDAYMQAKKNLERIKELYEAEAIPKTQLEQAQTAYLQAENGLKIAQDTLEKANSDANIDTLESAVEQAKVGVEQARRAVSNTKIVAPITGQIAVLNIEKGEIASPQLPLLQIVNQDQILVGLNVTESSLKNFELGKKLAIYVPAIDEKIEGEVTFIAPAANSQTLTFPIEIKVENLDQRIRSGMFVEVQVTDSEDEKYVVVPTQAVLGTGADTYVFVYLNGKAVKQNVKVKDMTSEETIISEGLNRQDKIIIKGQYGLEDGIIVEVIMEEGKSS
ncbi:hypothetical protein BHF71_01145 [Vulcanibacillus modesticaldus]|uniref:RND efflux pump membrane fusion protein barrel-sandwich domain-containing protein n=1 Tax=Vulcanibacillus modesticaldus TaxID=337097 RepID=A0A1D2YVV2_9BACI|nr:efflux RND transporter periplasmic adaptor subunit [Vulcanibacillus modesticaldus]OEF99811.1 hypothetical protein BHF71_01145 [Vulcanibacillus modesticaldus]